MIILHYFSVNSHGHRLRRLCEASGDSIDAHILLMPGSIDAQEAILMPDSIDASPIDARLD